MFGFTVYFIFDTFETAASQFDRFIEEVIPHCEGYLEFRFWFTALYNLFSVGSVVLCDAGKDVTHM